MAELALNIVLRIRTTNCCKCGVVIGIEKDYYEERLKDHAMFYCPSGHPQHFTGETEAEKLKKELEAQKRRTDMALADARYEADMRKKETTALKGKLTKLKNRVGNGVCPVPGCGRHFSNVERHVATKHPGFKSEDAPAGETKGAE